MTKAKKSAQYYSKSIIPIAGSNHVKNITYCHFHALAIVRLYIWNKTVLIQKRNNIELLQQVV